jgi:hypothetical protein
MHVYYSCVIAHCCSGIFDGGKYFCKTASPQSAAVVDRKSALELRIETEKIHFHFKKKKVFAAKIYAQSLTKLFAGGAG